MDKVDVVWNRDEVLHRNLDVLRIAAGMIAVAEVLELRAFVVPARQAGGAAAAAHAGLQHDPPADRHPGRSRRDDLARHVAPGDVRHRDGDVLESPPFPHVQEIQRARPHANEHLAGIELRLGRVLVPQDLGAAVLVEADSFHMVIIGESGDLVNW